MAPGSNADFPQLLAAIVGRRNVLTDARRTRRFRQGYRFGGGNAACVVRPGSLIEQWRVLKACAAAGVVVIPQAANTGITGGSTPDGDSYDRAVVILSTTRLRGIQLLGGGRQVVCLPGATLDALERVLAPLGREPHSVIGSSCLGASVVGGISNNSGGALVRRGPAYTEMALFARVDARGQLELVNRLGIALGDDPEAILARLEQGAYGAQDVRWDAGQGHDADYANRIRDVEASTPGRYNGDPDRLHDASGSGGHVVAFAVRVDTFPAETGARTFYIGTNDTDVLGRLRRHLLTALPALPIAGEYMHRDAFDMADRYGKDTVLFIERFGTRRLSAMFGLKNRLDEIARALPVLPDTLGDRVLQVASRFFPDHLPRRMRDFRTRYEHHLLLKVDKDTAPAVRDHLAATLSNGAGSNGAGDFFEATSDEAAKAFLHRFATAVAAIRYRAVQGAAVEEVVAVDVALPRNTRDWFEMLPADLGDAVIGKLFYGHFLCHVFHLDYVVRKGEDSEALEEHILRLLRSRGARAPAEHNFGHLYAAGTDVAAHYRALDPCNCFNPGTGKTTKKRFWAEAVAAADAA